MLELQRKQNERHYNQSGQQKNIDFTFVNRKDNKLIEVCQAFRCRDYLNDILFCEETNTKHEEVYGFTFDPKQQRIDRDKTRLIMHLATTDMYDNFMRNQAILSSVELANGYALTDIIKLGDKIICVEGDPIWMKANYMISLYSYLLKCCVYQFPKLEGWETQLTKQVTNEGRYLNNIGVDKFKFLTRHLNEIMDPYKGVSGMSNPNIHSVHDFTGFLNTFVGGRYIEDQNSNSYAIKCNKLWTNLKSSTNSSKIAA